MRIGVAETARVLRIILENGKACLDKDYGLHMNKSFNLMLVL